jgi:hypothetical protein
VHCFRCLIGLFITVLRVAVVGEQRSGPGEQPERQLGSGRERPVGEPRDRRMRQPGLAASRGRLDQVGQHAGAYRRGIGVVDGQRGPERRLVIAQAELEHGQAVLDENVLCAVVGARGGQAG